MSTVRLEGNPLAGNDVKFDLGEVSLCFDKRLRYFICKRVSKPEDIEDLMQSTYLEALRNLDKFRWDSRPETWLFGIANNLVNNHIRSQYRKPLELDINDWGEQLSCDNDPSDLSEHQRLLTLTLQAITGLSVDMQAVVYLIVDSDMGYKEAASCLGVPVGTVRSRLARARTQLKKQLFKEELNV
ncbi:RNA polymerase sigma factor [Pseudomonas fluorescens]|uniref:RNA polymerase sigma factor n=1 Tax=Pseudomonas fluorescens TaxID=294 RepID=UPI001BEBFA5B|nr:sigma-70 family RNA polymerase sigma factor [Pseudomonas fluorescens]MBT2373118.1 sigma-70 family RNA polymerase sigma factor [Pseudomonas fluorescens]